MKTLKSVEWKVIEQFPEYDVSSDGRVRKRKIGKVLAPVYECGYPRVTLVNSRTDRRTVNIHRLMGEAFLIPNEQNSNKKYVDHINRIRTDNRLENLRLVTAIENRSNQRSRKGMKRMKIVEIIKLHEAGNNPDEILLRLRRTVWPS